MSNIVIRPPWGLPESAATPEPIYRTRRRFLRDLGFAGGGIAALLSGCDGGREGGGVVALAEGAPDPTAGGRPGDPTTQPAFEAPPGAGPGGAPGGANTTPAGLADMPADIRALYPARKDPSFRVDGRPMTPEEVAAGYNNFYEFTTAKSRVREMAAGFHPRPWTVEAKGLCARPGTYDLDDLLRRTRDHLQERIYRFRCVEAWSMVVPWTGVPLRRLLDVFEPTAGARYVRFVTVLRPDEMPGQRPGGGYPWPYFEGLRMDEATNDLTLAVTGIYGHPMPNQHGAPLRLVLPWKYGFKSIKSVVEIEFQEHQPPTFWNTLVPREYDFFANVDPATPHPRWSQATERDIGQGGAVIDTLPFNGYGAQVAGLY